MSSINEFPEYRPEAWNWPGGFMGNDQRHKTRLYASSQVPSDPRIGMFTIGAVQRVDTGVPYDIGFTVNPTSYITNPGYITAPTAITYYVDGRGPLRTDTIAYTDLSLVWSKKVHGRLELFCRGLLYNVFNRQGVVSVDTTVSSNASPGLYTAASLPAFNPYTATPVADVNYRYGPLFGQPTAPSSYQTPRTASVSFGVRF